jgi:uncharacterized OsmC-like protein
MTADNTKVIDVSALKSFVDRVKNDPDQRTASFKVKTEWKGQTKTVTTVSNYGLGGTKFSRDFQIHADERPELLGGNTAPNPQELLMADLNACLSVGHAANAAATGIHLEKLEIETEGQLDLRGFLGLDSTVKPGYEEIHYTVVVKSSAPQEKLEETASIDHEDISEPLTDPSSST